MKLVVCGASGYIGTRLCQRAAAQLAVLPTSSSGRAGTTALDLAQPESFDAGLFEAGDVLVLAAAISSPDVCAREPARARAVNVAGTVRIAERARERGARVLFFSSDTVYGERAEAFDESAPCSPVGDYAHMKHEVERHFAADPGFRSLRLSYVFSRDDRFTTHLRQCARDGVAAEIFDPFVRAIVHREDVVDGVLALVSQWDRQQRPVFNFGGPEALSRAGYAATLQAVAWPALTYRVVTPEPAFFNSRPRRIAMRSPGLAALLGRAPRALAEAAAMELTPSEA